jgi:hypothetical protein
VDGNGDTQNKWIPNTNNIFMVPLGSVQNQPRQKIKSLGKYLFSKTPQAYHWNLLIEIHLNPVPVKKLVTPAKVSFFIFIIFFPIFYRQT